MDHLDLLHEQFPAGANYVTDNVAYPFIDPQWHTLRMVDGEKVMVHHHCGIEGPWYAVLSEPTEFLLYPKLFHFNGAGFKITLQFNDGPVTSCPFTLPGDPDGLAETTISLLVDPDLADTSGWHTMLVRCSARWIDEPLMQSRVALRVPVYLDNGKPANGEALQHPQGNGINTMLNPDGSTAGHHPLKYINWFLLDYMPIAPLVTEWPLDMELKRAGGAKRLGQRRWLARGFWDPALHAGLDGVLEFSAVHPKQQSAEHSVMLDPLDEPYSKFMLRALTTLGDVDAFAQDGDFNALPTEDTVEALCVIPFSSE